MLIDVDEFGISLEKCNCTGGWALRVFRVRKDVHYHHGAKITVLFAIKPGDPALPLLSVQGIGSGLSMESAQQSTSSGISVIISAWRWSSLEWWGQMTKGL
jgi:hypothetical protein